MTNPAERFALPPRSVFEPPSYPNVWFYVHERLATSHEAAVTLVTGWLRDHCGLTDNFGHWKPPEGSDSQARVGGLQPWEGSAEIGAPSGRYARFAGSVHYEVADEHPLHPSIDDCPYCGRTGSYAQAADLFAGAHEPLGLELLLRGTIRGDLVTRPGGGPAGGIERMQETHAVRITKIRPDKPDMNIVDLAVVLIGPRGA